MPGKKALTNSAHNNGHRSSGNTLHIIIKKDSASDIPSIGCDMDRNTGATNATAMFICIVYDTKDAEFPPSLAVMTAAAVAVGHTVQSMAASRSTRTPCAISLKRVMES